jgi:metal-responsive CopG/Arc/MetJ family transcriptional regulator
MVKGSIVGGVKVKTSLTLSPEILDAIDRRTSGRMSRSEFVERAVSALIARLAKQEQDVRDLEILNRRAADLNREAADVLDYQVIP